MSEDWARRPIAEHYESLRGFKLISTFETKGAFVDFIAVVASFTEIKSTRGTDMSRSLIVCDPSRALNTNGLLVQFYKPTIEQLPRPAVGSIIILKQFKLFDYRGVYQAWTHNLSKWIIYDPNGEAILSKSDKFLSDPSDDVKIYIKRLAGWWKTRSGLAASTNLAVPQNLNSATAHTTGRPTILLRDFSEGKFCDVYGYVVKTYPSRDNAFTVYLTDYTRNSGFHDYVYGESKWAGPYGQQTLQVTLWDINATYANSHIHDDQYILLRNVQGKRSDSGRLEGAVRGDRMHPSRVHVIVIERDDPHVKAIKLRRAQYESTWKIEKEKLDEEIILQHQAERAMQLTPPPSVNPNLATSYQQVPITAVGDILEPPFIPRAERQEGQGGRKRPHRFRTVARIIDFWPADLRDFSRPYCMSCQASYEPSNTEDMLKGDGNFEERCTLCGAEKDADDPSTYEFSFTILIEGQDSVCIPVIFSGDEVETLLGSDLVPCNLHLPQNQTMLNKLREKLFLLWGSLEEDFNAAPLKKKKKRRSTNDGQMKADPDAPLMWNELCIMEYWVNEAAGQAGWSGRRFKGFGMTIL